MRKSTSTLICFLFLAAAMAPAAMFGSKKDTDTVPQAPIPSQIATAKRLFIANLGGDDSVIPYSVLASGMLPLEDSAANYCVAGETYNRFYAALKSWNRYEVVSSPKDADLVFEISYLDEIAINSEGRGGTAILPPRIHLVIVDPVTKIPLWAFTERVETALLASNKHKNYVTALNVLVADVAELAKKSAAGTK